MGYKKIIKLAAAAALISSVLVLGCGYQGNQTEIAGLETSGFSGSDKGRELISLMDAIVSPPVVTSHSQNEEVYAQMGNQLIFIEGNAGPGDLVEVKVNGLLKADGLRVKGDGFFKTSEGIEIVEGKNRIEVTAVNREGRKSNPTILDVFLNVASRVDYTIFDDSNNLREIPDIYFLKKEDPNIYISGNYEPLAEIYVQVNGKIVAETVADGRGDFSFENVKLRKGENEIAVWGKIQDQTISQPVFSNILVTMDTKSPYPSNLKGYADDFGNHLTWTVSDDENFYSYKLVRVEDPCTNPEYPDHDVIATFNERQTGSYTDEDVVRGRSYFYTLWTLDKAGNAISSNVLAMPPPVYSINIKRLPPFDHNTVGRRQWYYQYFRITNTGNVTVDLQPIMVWLKLAPDPREEDLFPLWEVHIWDADSGQYYYRNDDISETYIPDYWAIQAVTETGEIYEYVPDGNDYAGDEDGNNEGENENGNGNENETEPIKVKDITTKQTQRTEGKRVMETTVKTVDALTGEIIKEESTHTLVEPERIGSLIQGLKPGHSVELAVKIQNITAAMGDQITVHFHFAPVDCAGYFFTDEEVSTQDITVISTGRN